MDDCCKNNAAPVGHPSRALCPRNGKPYGSVARATVLHHLAKPWSAALLFDSYYFCDDPECAVVYFAADGSVFESSAVRTEVGQKLRKPNSTLCYCFGITYSDASANPALRNFVILETKRKSCACESRNPSGACCLKQFPAAGASTSEA